MRKLATFALLLAFALQAPAGDFVTNPAATLPANTRGTKTNIRALPGGADPTKYIQATDYNEHTTRIDAANAALMDVKTWTAAPNAISFTATNMIASGVVSGNTILGEASGTLVTATGAGATRTLAAHLATLPDAKITPAGGVVPRSLADLAGDASVLSARSTALPPGTLTVPFNMAAGAAAALTEARYGTAVPFIFTRVGSAPIVVGGAPVSVPANQMRIADSPRGVEIMPANENLLVQSQDFSTADWAKAYCSILGSNTVAPDGTLTGTALVEDGSTAVHYLAQYATVPSGSPNTLAIYVKAGIRGTVQLRDPGSVIGGYFDLVAGTVTGTVGAGTPAIESAGNGWWRLSVSGTRSNTSGGLIVTPVSPNGGYVTNYAGSNGSIALYVWGAQISSGAGLRPYLQAMTASATVAAESLSLTSRLLAAHGTWRRSIVASPAGSWRSARGIWAVGSGANSASLSANGMSLVFTLTDSAGLAQTVTHPLVSLSAGSHGITAGAVAGRAVLYVDGEEVGVWAGSGSGRFSSLSSSIYIGGAAGNEFGGVLYGYREAPESPSAERLSVRVGVVSDIHAMTDAGQPSVLYSAAAAAQLAAKAPDLLAVAGDIVNEQPTTYALQFGYVSAAYTLPGVARLFILGNHDVNNSPGLTIAAIRAAMPADASSWLQAGQVYGSRDIAGVHVIALDTTYQQMEPATHTGLDSGTNNASGYVPQAIRDWLAVDLASTTLPVIIFIHQATGAWDPSWGGSRLANYADMTAIFEAARGKIAAVISGHAHKPFWGQVNGINYFICNSNGYKFTSYTTQNAGNHALLELDLVSRVATWSVWENDSVNGYQRVGSTTLPW